MSRILLAPVLVLTWLVVPGLSQERKQDEVQVIEVPSVPDKTPTPDLSAAAASIVKQTNDFRKEEGREPVKVDDKLRETAQYFADYMAQNDRYGHTADGTQPGDRAKKYGYDLCLVSENIAYAFRSEGFDVERLSNQFTTGWKNSPGHRRNMLDPDVTETGVAIARSEKTGYYYAVQMFGRPKSDAIEFRIENKAGEAFQYRIDDREYTLEPRFTRTHSVCRPPEIEFQFDSQKNETRKAKGGEKLVVTRSGGQWSVKKE